MNNRVKYLVIGALLVFMSLGFAWLSYAQEPNMPFYNANQFTVTWSAVTEDADGDPITGVTYKLYLANTVTDPEKKNPVIVYDGAETQAVITLGVKGRYFIGVQAWLDEINSEINWADEPEYQGGYEVFGIRFASPPKTPPGLRR